MEEPQTFQAFYKIYEHNTYSLTGMYKRIASANIMPTNLPPCPHLPLKLLCNVIELEPGSSL